MRRGAEMCMMMPGAQGLKKYERLSLGHHFSYYLRLFGFLYHQKKTDGYIAQVGMFAENYFWFNKYPGQQKMISSPG